MDSFVDNTGVTEQAYAFGKGLISVEHGWRT